MKRKSLLLSAAIFAAASSPLAAQIPLTAIGEVLPPAPSGTIQVSGLKPFGVIEATGGIEIFVSVDPVGPVDMTVELNGCDPNRFKWWDDGGVLKLKYSPTGGDRPIMVKLNCRLLDRLTITDSSVTIKKPWVGNVVTIDLFSNAKLIADLKAVDLRLTARTGSTALITGEATWANYIVFARSTIDMRGFSPKSAAVRAYGSAECFVHATERLVVEAFDNAAVFYRGTPGVLRLEETRGGHINPIGN